LLDATGTLAGTIEFAPAMFALIKKFFSIVVPSVIKPLRILWNEVLGAIFIAFAVMLVRPTWKSYVALDDDPANFVKLLLSVLFLTMMAGFGIHAFWRARRISKH
jgi:hypothetical protein